MIDTQLTKQYFPFYSFRGTHKEIGQQYGEACKGLIAEHIDLAKNRLYKQTGATSDQINTVVSEFRKYVIEYMPQFDEEICGVAEGAGISIEDSYLLQLRAEVNKILESRDECTTYAIRKEHTTNNISLIGQDADLPAFYAKVGIVTEIRPNDMPAVLQFTPAGQISYIGINDAGVGCFGNYLTCDGWRTGFPRYLYSRFVLSHQDIKTAINHFSILKRASSRNLIMLDRSGMMADVETTATKHAIMWGEEGLLCHSNHYLSEKLKCDERQHGKSLENSLSRYNRMAELLHIYDGKHNEDTMKIILRDRTGKYPISRQLGDDSETDTITAASVIGEPEIGKILVAIGPPHQYEYKEYRFSE